VSARVAIGARLRALRWWIAVAVALLLGFLDLARGGLVLAPILLAAAYLVLVPTALLRR
jgi:hypothetical protein